MRTVYLDCFNGITGEALLGALIDMGIDQRQLLLEIKNIIKDDFSLAFEKHTRLNVAATKVILNITDNNQLVNSKEFLDSIIPEHDQDDLIIKGLNDIFKHFNIAKTKLLNDSPQKITTGYNECLQSAIITTGTFAAVKQLSPCWFMAAPLPITTAIPGDPSKRIDPLTLELAAGVKVKSSNNAYIFNSPLGIALLATLTNEYGPLPEMHLEKVGYGLAEHKQQPGTLLRIIMGNSSLKTGTNEKIETVITVQASIDDMNPEFYPYIIDRVLAAGALDVFLAPITMKKGRPANLLTALCKHDLLDDIVEVIFKESTTLGVRIREEKRIIAGRRLLMVDTIYGSIRVKIGYLHDSKKPVQIAPEFEDCKMIASERRVPIKDVYAAAYHEAFRKITLVD